MVVLAKPLFIDAPQALKNVSESLINCLPADLEIKIKNGEASVNKEEPYLIPPCKEGWDNSSVVIDTKTPYSPAKFEEYKAAAWVTKDAIVYKRNNVETRTYSLKEVKDFTLTKKVTESFYSQFIPYLKFVGPALFLLAFVGIYLLYAFRLIHLAFLALLIFLLGKVFNHTLSYSSSYKIGLYAITLGLIVDLALKLTSVWTNFYGFPFMVTILTLAVVFVNLIQPKKSS